MAAPLLFGRTLKEDSVGGEVDSVESHWVVIRVLYVEFGLGCFGRMVHSHISTFLMYSL